MTQANLIAAEHTLKLWTWVCMSIQEYLVTYTEPSLGPNHPIFSTLTNILPFT